MTGPPLRPVTPTVRVVAWPNFSGTGRHQPGSRYVEDVWLGTLGPTATWAWQRTARMALADPDRGVTVDAVDLAKSLGLGDGLAKTGQLARTITRMVGFHVATQPGDDVLAVRTLLPDLPAKHLARASVSARTAHEAHVRRTTPTGPGWGQ